MKGPAWLWPARAARWQRPALVAASVLFHIGVFTYLGAHGFGKAWTLRSEPEHFIPVEMEPRPLLPGEQVRVRPTPPRARPLPAPALADPDRPFRGRRDEDDQPTPPVPRPGPTVPGAPPAPAEVGTSPWTVRPEAPGDRVGRGLRTSPVGCRSRDLLTQAERVICDDRFGERAAAAAPVTGTGNPARDARFAREGGQRLAAYERRRLPLSGRPGVTLPHDCGGSNLGYGCAGSHLDPEFRQDPDATLNQNLGAQRGDPTAPRLPRPGQTGD